MQEPFRAVRVTDDVYWVGAIDWTIRDFHGYSTERGTSYNAFLILADKITLIDTVKAPFCEEMFSRIASVVDPAKIDYIVSNHSEMDHSGCLPQAIAQIKPERVFASANGVKALKAHFHQDLGVETVADGQTLSLGNRTLHFTETKMLHWPDSMISYLVEEALLFSQDGFGMHLAASQRFDEEFDLVLLEHEAAKYFANILLPFAPMVQTALKKVGGLDIKIIAPDHGPIWRTNLGAVLSWYARWAEQKPLLKALIVYETMWGSTEMMARSIEEGLVSEGIDVRSIRIRDCHRSNIATELLDTAALIVGSPTLNNQVFPTVAEILSYAKGLRRKNLLGAAFGSHGWSGGAVAQIVEALNAMKVAMIGDPVDIEYVPEKESLMRCRELGVLAARQIRERVG